MTPAGPIRLGIDSVQAETDAFHGADGVHVNNIVARVTAMNPSLAPSVVVRAGIEVRATGDLKLSGDWKLPAASSEIRASAPAMGDASVTLRAAGKLDVAHGISSGFVPGAMVDTASSDRGGSLRLTGGADLASSDVLAVRRDSTGDVIIGRVDEAGSDSAPAVTVRTTTGSIDARAARDVRLLNSGATLYTTGVPVPVPVELPTDDLINQDASVSPLLTGGGAVSVGAGRDVVGSAMDPTRPYVTDWWWRSERFGAQGWWSRYDLFNQGIATFGGGNVHVNAGRDLLNVHASAASSGLLADEGTGGFGGRFGGGNVTVGAGRDMVNGLLFASGENLTVRAQGGVRRDGTAGDPGPQLVHESTTVQVQAGTGIDLASVRSAGLTQAVSANTKAGGDATVIKGLADAASLQVQSAAGSIQYMAAKQPISLSQGEDGGTTALGRQLPGSVRMAAPVGSLTFAQGQALIVTPVANGQVQLLAQDDVTLGPLAVTATRALRAPVFGTASDELLAVAEAQLRHAGSADRSDRSPVHIASTEGSVSLTGRLVSARAVRVLAAEDVRLNQSGRIDIQHQPQRLDAQGVSTSALSEISLVQAGRDISTSTAAGGLPAGIDVAGPGDLVVLAGRTIDLGSGQGVTASGNRNNGTALPVGGANITLVAGLRADRGDYVRAAREGFALLGGASLVDHAGEVFALLSPSADASAAAQAFDRSELPEQLATLKTLLGEAAYQRGLTAFVRGLPLQQATDDTQALARFETLPAWQRKLAVTSMLTRAFGDLPAEVRHAFVASVAARNHTEGGQAAQTGFLSYVHRVTGSSGLSMPEALARFEALPLERKVVWINQALVGDLRRYGREATLQAGAEKDAAYGRGYLAIDAVFPVAERARSGDILLPTSQIRTVQQADITLLTPGGGVNAGALTGGASARAADLGILTVAGGDISAVVKKNFEVNQSRVFSLLAGDILLWSSDGNIDAGRGAKTVTGSPAPVLRLDADGRVIIDTSGSFSGSGIAVLDADSNLDLYAPQGEINAGDAGIKSVGNAFFGAVTIRGGDNLSVGGLAVGAPPPPPSGNPSAGLAASAQAATAAGQLGPADESEEEKRKRRRARRTLLLDFLGFGDKN